jgi:WD40 repeat protein
MTEPVSCPEPARWEELLRGALPAEEQSTLTAHLETCPTCQHTVERLAGGTEAWSRAARHLGGESRAGEAALRRVVADLEAEAGPPATQAEPDSAAEDTLDFLTPPEKPGSLGRLGHYEVSEVVGHGGMGLVLKAFDQSLQRVVAIKVMAPQLATSATARKRFVREAQAAAAVRNEHVIDIHAVEGATERPYLVMEYVSGASLQERLDRTGPLEIKEILRIGIQAAAGLAAAHAQGLVHRDVKPSNILLENGVQRVKLTDFGLARAVDDASLTQSGVVAGTPQYMAPEQARGEAVDHRADLFSLGSVLYALCTGRPPFRASGSMAVLKRVCEDTPRPIREINPEVPDWLVAVIARLHAKDPAARFQSAAEVAELLNGHLARLQQIVPAPLPERTTGTRRRWAAAVLLLSLGGLGLAEATGVTRVAATVIRILRPDGTLVVETDDPGIQVTIEADGGLVLSGSGPQEVRLRPGLYRLQASRDGQLIRTDLVTIARGDTRIVRVSREPARPADFRFRPPAPGPLDALERAKVPAAERFPWQPEEVVAVLGQHRGRHWTPQRHVTVSPDGKLTASCAEDPHIYVWEADTLRLRALLTGHTGCIWSVTFAPDSRHLLSGSDDGTLRLWDLEAPRELRCFRGHTGGVNSATFSPDGRRALSGGADRTVRLWDVETGRQRGCWEGHRGGVVTVAFSPDGAYALSGSNDSTMRLWEVKTGKEARCFRGHAACCWRVCFRPDGRRALSCSHDHTIRLWDVETGQELRRFEGHTDQVNDVAVSPDGRRALSGGSDRALCIWDLETGRRQCRLEQNAAVMCVGYAPGGQQALAGWGGALHWLDAATGKEPAGQPAGGSYDGCWKIAFSPDGRRVLSCMGEWVARLWDVEGGQELFQLQLDVPGVARSGAFFPGGCKVLCAGVGGMAVWDAVSGQELRRFAGTREIWQAALTADGSRVLTAHANGTLCWWDVESRRELARLVGHQDQVVAAALSPDQRRALSGSVDRTVRLWDLEGGREVFRYEGHTRKVCGVAFSPDGRHAASSADDGFVRLWDLTGAEPRVQPLPKWHAGVVRSVAFSPDGKLLASAGQDGRVVLWEVAAGTKSREWQLPGPVPGVAFAADGRHLATANANGTVYVLRLARP